MESITVEETEREPKAENDVCNECDEKFHEIKITCELCKCKLCSDCHHGQQQGDHIYDDAEMMQICKEYSLTILCFSCRCIIQRRHGEQIIVDMKVISDRDDKINCLEQELVRIRDENVILKNQIKVAEGNDLFTSSSTQKNQWQDLVEVQKSQIADLQLQISNSDKNGLLEKEKEMAIAKVAALEKEIKQEKSRTKLAENTLKQEKKKLNDLTTTLALRNQEIEKLKTPRTTSASIENQLKETIEVQEQAIQDLRMKIVNRKEQQEGPSTTNQNNHNDSGNPQNKPRIRGNEREQQTPITTYGTNNSTIIVITHHLLCPSKTVGIVVGKQGSRIKNLEYENAVIIVVERTKDNNNNQTIFVTGRPSNVKRTISVINKLILCKFHKNGTCRNGETCRFVHRQERNNSEQAESRQDLNCRAIPGEINRNTQPGNDQRQNQNISNINNLDGSQRDLEFKQSQPNISSIVQQKETQPKQSKNGLTTMPNLPL